MISLRDDAQTSFFFAPVLHTKAWEIALLAFVFVITSCSRHMLPGSSPEVTGSPMQAFISRGTGKRLDTHHILVILRNR